MTEQEAIWILKDFGKQITVKAYGAHQSTIGKMVCDMAISALEEIQKYREGKLCLIPDDVFGRQCKELDEYKELGTVEELREASKKQVPKKPVCKPMPYSEDVGFNNGWLCPCCGNYVDILWKE